ncbi:D-3-phosphoglycerate dehydrogenase [Fructobacillus pseudoficulneus]|uniref:D-3-phosphoglycerate dehydrogenase n=1 Tax=Fructobacillus pseudoficulneus TaxID=220714 RepID=A0A3F3H4N9_9LACO|nr:NAD(P)-dependent oxidoreductase [Fructobacillus pseudoficulneus]GAP02960.1 D-3-phosphoglycerate dehydrogenase [Fructobacillus pseudoficulneus]SEH44813.1 D-3-phosphoglycerate dehydrogenase [Fructobacillus pseudoficulneus]
MAKILVFDGIDESALTLIKKAGFEVVSNKQQTPEDFAGDPDVVGIILMIFDVDGAVMDRYPNLKVIARHGAGYDTVDLKAAAERGIVVTNTPGANATAVAETAVALMLVAGRYFGAYHDSITDSKVKNYLVGKKAQQVSGKIVGILGFGHIGQDIAKLLTGFGVHVLAYARHDRDVPNGRMASLDEIYQQADYIVSALPATPATTGMINQEAFDKMKSNAVIVNVGRGPVIDEQAMIDSLKAGKIAAAGLDVVNEEPIQPSNVLLSLPNVFVLPHIAGFSKEANHEVAKTAAEDVLSVIAGKGTDHQVN